MSLKKFMLLAATGFATVVAFDAQQIASAGTTNYSTNIMATNPASTGTAIQFPSNAPNTTNVYLELGDNNYLYFTYDELSSIKAAAHSGGTELSITSPRISIIPANGDFGAAGAVQFGKTGDGVLDGSHGLYYWNQSKYAQNTNDPLGYGYLLLFMNGSWASGSPVAFRSEAVDTNGTGQFNFYGGLTYSALSSADAGPNLNEVVGNSILQMRSGTNANTTAVVYHGALTRDSVMLTATATNFEVNWDGTNSIMLNISRNLNLTNITATPFARTNQEDTVTMDIYPGMESHILTVPANWLTNSAFTTNIAGSTVMTLRIRRQVYSSRTNYYAEQSIFNYPTGIDPLAAAFFSATGITDVSVKTAVDALCAGLRATGLLATNKLIELWPMIGPNAAANNAGLNGHNLIQHGTIINNAEGMTFDGATGYADTGIIPTNVFEANSSAMFFVYSRTTKLMENQTLVGAYDTSPAVYSGIQLFTPYIVASGENADSTSDGWNVDGKFNGFIAVNRTGAASQTIYGNNTQNTFTDFSSSGLGQKNSIYIGAKNDQGAADSFSVANLAGAGIFQNMTPADVANLQILMMAFNTSLGR